MKDKGYGVVMNWNYVTVSLVVFTILTVIVMYVPACRAFDMSLLKTIQGMLAPFPVSFAYTITEFGRANWMLWPQIAAVSTIVSHRRYLHAFLLVFFTQISFHLTGFIKDFVCRERPCSGYSGFSFPSTHAVTTMCFYGIIVYLILHFVKNEFWRYFLAIFFGIFIFLVALSRLWIGVHFPIDVVAGLFLGFMLVNLYIITIKFFKA